MNKEIQQISDDLVAKLRADGVELNALHEISILNAITVSYLNGQNQLVRHNNKAVTGGNHV